MTRTWLVSLLSDQMVPNILLARQLMADGIGIDRHLLISTKSMEEKGKSRIYIQLVGVPEQDAMVIKVHYEGVGSVVEELDKTDFSAGDRFLVNLTGGTKMMSMGAFKWFSGCNGVEFYYLPMGSSCAYRLDNETYERKDELPITVRLSVQEYLASYGVSIVSKNDPTQLLIDWMHNKLSVLWELSGDRESAVMMELDRMRESKKPTRMIEASSDLASWLAEHRFPLSRAEENRITKEEIRFLTGDWLEILVAAQVKKIHPDLAEDEIMCGAHIKRDEANNELDVIYMLNNAPRVIECKTLLEREYFDDTVYKLTTLRNSFGLTAKSAIVALHLGNNLLNQDGRGIKSSRMDRLNALGIQFLHSPEPDIEVITQWIPTWGNG